LSEKKRVLTGITTSGIPHIGNLAGAILPAIKASKDELTDSFLFLADYHSLIKSNDPDLTHTSSFEIAACWVACGLDPKEVIFYRQSDVPHIMELTWILSCLTSKGLMNRAHAYKAAVSKFTEYGKLSKKKIDDLVSGARVEIDEEKNNPIDFALWKFSESEPSWDSPWGKGRPGWHIECSAMSLKYLGENFEIHGGGRDLIFPHHENEIAQSESFKQNQFAKIWMHVGMITINGEKMSKSLGNVKSVSHVLENWGPNIIRLFCLSGSYSKPIDYTEILLKENITKLRQIESCYYELRLADGIDDKVTVEKLVNDCKNEFNSALNNDLNTPLALTIYYKLIREVNSLSAEEKLTVASAKIILPEFERMSDIIGIKILKVSDDEKKEINQMINKRDEYRAEKNYDEADKIREQIAGRNIIFVDHKNKTRWIKQEKINAE